MTDECRVSWLPSFSIVNAHVINQAMDICRVTCDTLSLILPAEADAKASRNNIHFFIHDMFGDGLRTQYVRFEHIACAQRHPAVFILQISVERRVNKMPCTVYV